MFKVGQEVHVDFIGKIEFLYVWDDSAFVATEDGFFARVPLSALCELEEPPKGE